MHVLLPPSEGKTTGGRGRPLGSRTSDGPLAAARSRTLAALGELLAGDPDAAAEALLLPPGVITDALAANRAVRTSPTRPALHRYTGVVYDGLDVLSLTAAEQRLAGRSALIFSGLFGVVRGDEGVPAYRVPGKAVLPGIGVVSTFWRPILTGTLDAMLRRGLVVDLRSGDYVAMWRPGSALAGRVVRARVLSPAPRGGHAVISFTSKLAKGQLARALIQRAAAGGAVTGVDDVAAAWADSGGAGCEMTESGIVDLYTT